MSTIKWQQTCCVWHGEYAEHATKTGGVARLKRSPDAEQWLVMEFDRLGHPVKRDVDGTPLYVSMSELAALELLM